MSLVGQEKATSITIQHIFGKISDPKRTTKPVVLLFAGPPGIGKSQMAHDISNAFGQKHSTNINCGDIIDTASHLFRRETGLGNFMQKHNGRVGVVVLEEFEKLSYRAMQAFLLPFESGEWPIKSREKTIILDCSKIIFLMTANEKTENSLEKKKAEQFSYFLGKELVRSFEVISFGPFNLIQQNIIVETMEEKICSRYKHPPNEARLFGSLDINFMPKFNKEVLEQYEENEGATSLLTVIQKSFYDAVFQASKMSPSPSSLWFYLNPTFNTRDYSFTKPEE